MPLQIWKAWGHSSFSHEFPKGSPPKFKNKKHICPPPGILKSSLEMACFSVSCLRFNLEILDSWIREFPYRERILNQDKINQVVLMNSWARQQRNIWCPFTRPVVTLTHTRWPALWREACQKHQTCLAATGVQFPGLSLPAKYGHYIRHLYWPPAFIRFLVEFQRVSQEPNQTLGRIPEYSWANARKVKTLQWLGVGWSGVGRTRLWHLLAWMTSVVQNLSAATFTPPVNMPNDTQNCVQKIWRWERAEHVRELTKNLQSALVLAGLEVTHSLGVFLLWSPVSDVWAHFQKAGVPLISSWLNTYCVEFALREKNIRYNLYPEGA